MKHLKDKHERLWPQQVGGDISSHHLWGLRGAKCHMKQPKLLLHRVGGNIPPAVALREVCDTHSASWCVLFLAARSSYE